jgi:hypothetical protein
MTVIGEAFIEILPVASDFAPKVQAQVEEAVKGALPAADQLGTAFDGASTTITERVGEASRAASESLGQVGEAAGLSAEEVASRFEALAASLEGSIRVATDSMTASFERAAEASSVAVGGFKDKFVASMGEVEAANARTDAAMAESNGAEDVSKGFEGITNTAGGLVGKLAGVTGSIPLVGESFKKMSEHLNEASSSGAKMSSVLNDVGKMSLGAGAALAAGIGVESVNLASKQQTAAAALAASAQISTKAATSIGDAFTSTAFKSVYSGTEMTEAYTGVAAQLGATQGHALSTAQAMSVMTTGSDLAEASGTDLATTISTLSSVLQTYGLGVHSAAGVSNELFAASQMTGQGIGTLGNALDQVKARLGGMAPPIGQLGGLLVDLTEHGETGRQAMTALSTTFTAFLKPASAVATAQNNLRDATKALPPSLQGLAAEYQKGTITSEEATAATEGLTTAQAAAFATFTTASKAVVTAQAATDKMGISATTASGKLRPMGDIIGQLQKQIAGQSTAQAVAQLTADGFANASAKLVGTIQAGPAAFNKATAAVTAQDAAHAAAEKQAQTLSHQVELLKTGLEDEGVKIGQALIPILTKLGTVVEGIIGWFEKHRTVALALGAVIAGALTAAIGTFVVLTGVKMVGALKEAGSAVAGVGQKMLGMGGKATEASGTMSEANVATSGAFDDLVASVTAATTEIKTALGLMAASAEGDAATMEGAIEGVGGATEEMAATVETAAPEAGFAMDSMLGPIGLLIPVIMLVASHWKAIWGAIKDVAKDVFDFLKPAITGFVDFFKNAWTDIEKPVVDVFNDIQSIISDVVSWIESHWQDLVEGIIAVFLPGGLIIAAFIHWHTAIIGVVTGVITDVVNFFTGLPAQIITAISSFLALFTGWLMEDLVTPVTTFLTTVINWFTGLPARVMTAIDGLVGLLDGWLESSVLTPVETFLTNVINWFTGLPARVMTAIDGLVGLLDGWLESSVLTPVETFLTNVVTWFSGLPGRAVDALSQFGSDIDSFLTSNVYDKFQTFYNNVLGLFSGLPGDVVKAIDGLGTAIQSFFNSSVLPDIKTPINAVIGGLNFVIGGVDDIAGLVNLKGPSKIPTFAQGGSPHEGFRTSGPAFIVGEGSQSHPEWVIATDPAFRDRNLSLWREAGKQLGIDAFASGGRAGGLSGAAATPVTSGSGGSGGLFGAIGAIGHAISDVASDVASDITSGAADVILDPLFSTFEGMIGNQFPILTAAAKSLEIDIKDWVGGKSVAGKLNPPSPAYSAGGGAGQWAGTVASVLAELGKPASAQGAVLDRIAFESGGNPAAVNKYDINWQEGHPSVGLIQVIKGTFEKYAGKYLNTGPFAYGVSEDPRANLFAGINYAYADYGYMPDPKTTGLGYYQGGVPALSVGGVPVDLGAIPFRKYDRGGTLAPGLTMSWNDTGFPEFIPDPASYRGGGPIAMAAGGSADSTITVSEGAVVLSLTLPSHSGQIDDRTMGAMRAVATEAIVDAMTKVNVRRRARNALAGAR